MKKILFIVLFFALTGMVKAQDDTTHRADKVAAIELKEEGIPAAKPKKVYILSNRSNDHFMAQLGYTMWTGQPDSIQTKGFSRSVNFYFMFDFPFKATPQFSAAIGLGVGSDHIVFDKSYPNLKGQTTTLRFNRAPDTTYFKKTKLATTYLEAPIELRYISNPERSEKSFKMALGVKVGTMIKAGVRGRQLMSNSGVKLNDYQSKEASKRYFNTTRVVGTARVGYGVISLFATYQITKLLKDVAGPELRPFTVGLTLSGL